MNPTAKAGQGDDENRRFGYITLVGMMDCTVSIVGEDGRTYTLDVNASSLFDAAAQARRRWAMLWWYRSEAVMEVRAGDRIWKVRGERVREWQSKEEGKRKA
jgi:hypothetical protein